MSDNQEATVKFKVIVHAYGVKKRCRKSEGHMLKLGYTDYKEELTQDDINALLDKAKAALAENMKSTVRAKISLLRVECKPEYGGQIESFLLYDERHKSLQIDLGV
jgi:hypothetical protein